MCKNDLPMAYSSAFADAELVRDLEARGYMNSQLIEMLVTRLGNADEYVKDMEETSNAEKESLREEIADTEDMLAAVRAELAEAHKKWQAKVDDLEVEIAKRNLVDVLNTSILNEGAAAYLADLGYEDSPYDSGTPEAELWDAGWREAMGADGV